MTTPKSPAEMAAIEYNNEISALERITHKLPDDFFDATNPDHWIASKGFMTGARWLLEQATKVKWRDDSDAFLMELEELVNGK